MAEPKKSETIEIRLSYQMKQAFMRRCRDEQRSASDAVRTFIDGELRSLPGGRRKSRPSMRLAAAAALGAALGLGAAAPSFAQASQTSKAVFDQLDRNHDGVLTYHEFHSR